MPIQNDADLVKNSGPVGMIRLYDGRSLGLFKFEVAETSKLPADLRPAKHLWVPFLLSSPADLTACQPAYATDKGERADCEYSRFANNRFTTNLEIVSSIDLTDCRPLQLKQMWGNRRVRESAR